MTEDEIADIEKLLRGYGAMRRIVGQQILEIRTPIPPTDTELKVASIIGFYRLQLEKENRK